MTRPPQPRSDVTRAATFRIPPELWLTSNRHSTNRGHRSRVVAAIHNLASATAVAYRLDVLNGPVAVDWTIHYPKGVRTDKGDASNAQPTCKAILDGLVPRWLEDDGPKHVVSETYRRGPNLTEPRWHDVRLVLTPQEVPF